MKPLKTAGMLNRYLSKQIIKRAHCAKLAFKTTVKQMKGKFGGRKLNRKSA